MSVSTVYPLMSLIMCYNVALIKLTDQADKTVHKPADPSLRDTASVCVCVCVYVSVCVSV